MIISFGVSLPIILLIKFVMLSYCQWCESLQSSSGFPSQSALFNRILSGSSISFCPFVIEGDGCDLTQGIHIHGYVFLHCDIFLVPLVSSYSGCIINCPGRHWNISGTLSLDGPWMFTGATHGSTLLQSLGNLVAYRTSWFNNTNYSGQGAALYTEKGSNLHLISPSFISNDDSNFGGVLFLENTNAYVYQGIFSNNSGVGVHVKETDYGVAFYNSLFEGNRGPVLVECSDVSISSINAPGSISSVKWVNNIFRENKDEEGVTYDCVDFILGTPQCLETSQLCNKTIATLFPSTGPSSASPTLLPSKIPSVSPTILRSQASQSFSPTLVPSNRHSMAVTDFPSAASTLISTQYKYFSFKSRWSKDTRSWCIGLSSMKLDNGNVIRLRLCKNSDAQKWLYDVRTGRIHNKSNSTFCLASRGGRTGAWDGLELWNCSDDSSKWLEYSEDHTITYKNMNNPNFQCVTLQEGAAKEAQMLRLQPCSFNSSVQQWDRV